MFLVQKANLSSHFRSPTKKPSPTPKPKPPSQSFNHNIIISHLTKHPPTITFTWLSSSLSFLSTLHTEAADQILNSKPDNINNIHGLYMGYSLKILDLCNLISSAIQRLTDRRMLVNYALRLLTCADRSEVTLNKAKDALARSGDDTHDVLKEKGLRAKELIEELAVVVENLPRGGLYEVGVVSVLIGSVLVRVLFGEVVEFRMFDLVNCLEERLCEVVKVGGILEVGDVAKQAGVVCGIIDDVSEGGDGVSLDDGVKEMGVVVRRFSDGVDGLTNGVNGLFRAVLKTRNGRLDV